MNSTIRSIFNESFIEKKKICGSCEQCIGPTKNVERAMLIAGHTIQMDTKGINWRGKCLV